MAKIDKVLGSISPLYGAVTGRGVFGSGFADLGDVLGQTSGAFPALAKAARDKRRNIAANEAMAAENGMKKGGKVKKMAKGGSASRRADGCATKGKTKGRFV